MTFEKAKTCLLIEIDYLTKKIKTIQQLWEEAKKSGDPQREFWGMQLMWDNGELRATRKALEILQAVQDEEDLA